MRIIEEFFQPKIVPVVRFVAGKTPAAFEFSRVMPPLTIG